VSIVTNFEIPEDPDWQYEAACRTPDNSLVDTFYPVSSDTAVSKAKEICHTQCTVREECLEYALANHEVFGVWGGTSERERRRIASGRRRMRLLGGR